MQQNLRVALVNRLDTQDVTVLSGTPYFMVTALERQSVSVTSLGPVTSIWMKLGRYLHGAAQLVGRRYDWTHSLAGSTALGKKFDARLKRGSYDIIFAPMASTEIAYLQSPIPIIYLTDMTYALGRSSYASFQDLLPFSEREGWIIERRAISNSAQIVVPSQWAAKSFVDDCGADPKRVHVVSFGINLEDPPSRDEALTDRSVDTCRLLLLGVDWERKGGPLALEVLKQLLSAGIKAELVVCGCQPPVGTAHSSMRVLPFLNKNRPQEARQLRQLLLTSTFLLVPSRDEAWGLVFAEASACGLPSVTRDTGGIAGVVEDGVNGLLLPAEAGPAEYCARIVTLLHDPARYRSLCVTSRNEFENRLNWDVWAARMVDIFAAAKDSNKRGIASSRG